jgi:hypothetical protein
VRQQKCAWCRSEGGVEGTLRKKRGARQNQLNQLGRARRRGIYERWNQTPMGHCLASTGAANGWEKIRASLKRGLRAQAGRPSCTYHEWSVRHQRVHISARRLPRLTHLHSPAGNECRTRTAWPSYPWKPAICSSLSPCDPARPAQGVCIRIDGSSNPFFLQQ